MVQYSFTSTETRRLVRTDSTGRKLQAPVYDILPWRKVPESDARSVHRTATSTLTQLLNYDAAATQVQRDEGSHADCAGGEISFASTISALGVP